MASCDDGGDDTPQPSSITLTLTSATKDGVAISPTPGYSVTFDFTADGTPDGYTVNSNTASFVPTIGSTGTFSVSGSTATFSDGSLSRMVSITAGSISSEATTVSLQWELTKIDDGVTADEAGTYVYVLSE